MGTPQEIARLREDMRIDYDRQIWTVTAHRTYDHPRWPADEWTLESGTEVRVLEHEYDGEDVFRLFRAADLADVTVDGMPVQRLPRAEEPPGTVTYQGTEYELAEEDPRIVPSATLLAEGLTRSEDNRILVGVCGGIAEYTGLPSAVIRGSFVVGTLALNLVFLCLLMPLAVLLYGGLAFAMPEPNDTMPGRDLVHYWVYQHDESCVVLECTEPNAWSVYVGREVDAREFDHVRPHASD